MFILRLRSSIWIRRENENRKVSPLYCHAALFAVCCIPDNMAKQRRHKIMRISTDEGKRALFALLEALDIEEAIKRLGEE
jgi:hypothetical protein